MPRRTCLALGLVLVFLSACAGVPRGDGAITRRSKVEPERIRAVWVDSWGPGMASAAECDALIQHALAANYNTLIVEVRKVGDAYYRSRLEPRAPEIGNFDPLQYFVDEAKRKRGLRVEAWIVANRVWKGREAPPVTEPTHLVRANPEWLLRHENGAIRASESDPSVYVDASHPQAREFVAAVAADITRQYDVDAIHLDYIRFPEGDWGLSPASVSRFKNDTGFQGELRPDDSSYRRWRARQVTEQVATIRQAIRRVDPTMDLTAATLTWGELGAGGYQATRGYQEAAQDWPAWCRQGLLDIAYPMHYKREHEAKWAKDYRRWLTFFEELRAAHDTRVVVGVGAYMNDREGSEAQIRDAWKSSLDGVAIFSYRAPNRGQADPSFLRAAFDARRAEIRTCPPNPARRRQSGRGFFRRGVDLDRRTDPAAHGDRAVGKPVALLRQAGLRSGCGFEPGSSHARPVPGVHGGRHTFSVRGAAKPGGDPQPLLRRVDPPARPPLHRTSGGPAAAGRRGLSGADRPFEQRHGRLRNGRRRHGDGKAMHRVDGRSCRISGGRGRLLHLRGFPRQSHRSLDGSPGEAGLDEQGRPRIERPAILVSDEAHYCSARAAHVMGWGAEGFVHVPTDDRYRMKPEALAAAKREAESRGRRVIAVVASACSTSTGAYDPLEPIADFCEAEDLWLHVDGAHGASALLSPGLRERLAGVERADSLVWDAHKLLMMPALSTAVIYRQPEHATRALAQRASYLFDGDPDLEWFNVGHRTIECTKTMMASVLYASVALYGEALFRDYVERIHDRALEFTAMLNESGDFSTACAPESNIVCFRHEPSGDEEIDARQRRIRRELIQSGDFYVVQTSLGGRPWLRCTIMNPKTERRHFRALMEAIRSL